MGNSQDELNYSYNEVFILIYWDLGTLDISLK